MITTTNEFAIIVGPPLAGILIGRTNAAVVIAIDAISFAVLAATYRLAVPFTGSAHRAETAESPTAGFSAIFHDRALLGLLTLSFGFFLLFWPFYVAMPIHVADDLHASAAVLGAYTAFGVGAVIGGLVTGYLRRWPLWPTPRASRARGSRHEPGPPVAAPPGSLHRQKPVYCWVPRDR